VIEQLTSESKKSTALTTTLTAPVLMKEPKTRIELIHSFVGLRAGLPGNGIFAFTAANPREGVTHVVRALGEQLARYTGTEVLIVSTGTLRSLSPASSDGLDGMLTEYSPGLWGEAHPGSKMPGDGKRIDSNVWRALRKRFEYILVDCGPLSRSSEILAIGPDTDGTVLVVAAGHSRKQEIKQAARLLAASDSRFVGCILNKRTYPVPAFLYKFF
jgi:hypothetical protein